MMKSSARKKETHQKPEGKMMNRKNKKERKKDRRMN